MKLSIRWAAFGLALAMLSLAACKDDEPKTSTIDCSGENLVSDSMKYSTVVLPILQSRNCISCHSNANPDGGVNLEGHANVKAYGESGKLVGSIAHLDGFDAMPKNAGKMPQTEICKIQLWVQRGAPND